MIGRGEISDAVGVLEVWEPYKKNLAGRAGLSLHFPKVSPLLYNAAIWKPADAVVAVRPFANFALASTLRAEYRRRICKRRSTLRANGEGRKNNDYGSHLMLQ
jgi:hypothetical protein